MEIIAWYYVSWNYSCVASLGKAGSSRTLRFSTSGEELKFSINRSKWYLNMCMLSAYINKTHYLAGLDGRVVIWDLENQEDLSQFLWKISYFSRLYLHILCISIGNWDWIILPMFRRRGYQLIAPRHCRLLNKLEVKKCPPWANSSVNKVWSLVI